MLIHHPEATVKAAAGPGPINQVSDRCSLRNEVYLHPKL
jgi:hypothetical protein